MLVVLLWFVLFAAYGLVKLNQIKPEQEVFQGLFSEPKLCLADYFFFGLFAWHTVSGLQAIAYQTLEPRPAIHLIWQQLSMAIIYAAGRTLFSNRQRWPMAALAMVAGTLAIALFSWYQYLVTIPDLHFQYQAASEIQKQQMLLQGGVSDALPGSRMRQLFESRLFNREPFGTFTLANSLAGLLVPMTVIALVATVNELTRRRRALATTWGIAWLILAGCLALTSSRTGVLSVVLISFLFVMAATFFKRKSSAKKGAAFDVVATTGPTKLSDATYPNDQETSNAFLASQAESTNAGRKTNWVKLGVVSMLVLLPILIVGCLWALGQSDSRLWSSAPESIRYRLEYWIASARMIFHFPVFGCGPGSFQSCYAAFQLPQSSETVSDPHNAWIELTATAGIPAGLCFMLGVTWAIASHWPSKCKNGQTRGAITVNSNDGIGQVLLPALGLIAASLIGLAVSWLYGLMPGPLWLILACVGAATCWASIGLVLEGREANPSGLADHSSSLAVEQWPKWGMAALLVHLFASGGINYPAIGQYVFFLAGICISQTRNAHGFPGSSKPTGGRVSWMILVGLSMLAATYAYYFDILPVMRSNFSLQRSSDNLAMGNLSASGRFLRNAVAEDPYNSEARSQLAITSFLQSMDPKNNSNQASQIEQLFQDAADLRPFSSPLRIRFAETFLTAAWRKSLTDAKSPQVSQLLEQTATWLQAAIARKPTDARLLAQRSWLKWQQGDQTTAVRLAEQAWSISQQSPHDDLKLQRLWFTAWHLSKQDSENANFTKDQIKPADLETSNAPQFNAAAWVQWVKSKK